MFPKYLQKYNLTFLVVFLPKLAVKHYDKGRATPRHLNIYCKQNS